MSKRTLFENESPVTQSIEAVRAMCAALGKPIKGEGLPEAVKLGHDVALVLSANMDCYYTCTREHGCSCLASFYHPDKPCKHQRKYLGMPPIKATADDIESVIAKYGSFKPTLESCSEAV